MRSLTQAQHWTLGTRASTSTTVSGFGVVWLQITDAQALSSQLSLLGLGMGMGMGTGTGMGMGMGMEMGMGLGMRLGAQSLLPKALHPCFGSSRTWGCLGNGSPGCGRGMDGVPGVLLLGRIIPSIPDTATAHSQQHPREELRMDVGV
ncbi:hypothetical protein TURU_102515 [Turdus rufiventris]|nr:hypothetical protein TURU_102515 [Turdus rufiventris]